MHCLYREHLFSSVYRMNCLKSLTRKHMEIMASKCVHFFSLKKKHHISQRDTKINSEVATLQKKTPLFKFHATGILKKLLQFKKVKLIQSLDPAMILVLLQ